MARILVVNAGSSSVKLSLIGDADDTLAAHEMDAPQSAIDAAALRDLLADGLGAADAVGHRIVHGGARFRHAVRIDREVEQSLRELADLAPLHQRKSLDALDAVSTVRPDLPAIACFDTAFHATLPAAARTYALPARWRERWPLRRYGFHGLSHAWVSRRAPQLLRARADDLRIVSAHLGAGVSLCAIAGGRSIDTTMGFTPLEGLVMATRSGSVDPGLLLWLLEHSGLTERELADALEHDSGLLGLAGSADMRVVLARAAEGDAAAQLAVDVYVHRLCAAIAAMAASLGGIDALVFTGGVGERSPDIRAACACRLAFLGITIEDRLNGDETRDRLIAPAGATVSVLVVHAREDLEIARQAREVLEGPPRSMTAEKYA